MNEYPDSSESFEPVEDQLEIEPVSDVGPGFPWGGLLAMLVMALIVVFAVQNTSSVEVNFLWIDGEFPLALVILITAMVSILATVAGGALYRRRRHRRRREKEQLRQLRSDS